MAVSFPGRIPPPRQNPYPDEPAYGNMTSDIGQGLRQTGDDLMELDKSMDADKSRHAKLTDMVERRKQALAVQKAREDYQQKTMEFNKAKEAQDITESERNYNRGVKEYDDTAKVKAEAAAAKKTEEDEAKTNMSNARQQLLAHEEKTGKPASRDMTRKIGLANNVPDWTNLAGDRPYKKTSGSVTAEEKKKSYRAWVPKLKTQLDVLVGELEGLVGETFDRNRLITSMQGLESRVEKVPSLRDKRAAIASKKKEITAKSNQIDKISSMIPEDEGPVFPGDEESSSTMAGKIKQEADLAKEQEATLKKLMGN